MKIKTKFGNASLKPNEYYVITSVKEGNYDKRLHILIWEDHYKLKKPDGYVIHHINGIKADNRIQNLQCVLDKIHRGHHNKKVWTGRKHNKETLIKISKNRTGKLLGESNPNSKLKRNQVKEIKLILKENNLNQEEIGRLFGVSTSCINMIYHNKTWKNVDI
ncbi:MAG: HNH endonuclease [Methanobrevibacter sp.]|nr:HNH endonuclease [Methanobrevibacter sp.]